VLSEKSPGSARQGSLDGDLFLVRGEMRVVGVGHFLHQLIVRCEERRRAGDGGAKRGGEHNGDDQFQEFGHDRIPLS